MDEGFGDVITDDRSFAMRSADPQRLVALDDLLYPSQMAWQRLVAFLLADCSAIFADCSAIVAAETAN